MLEGCIFRCACQVPDLLGELFEDEFCHIVDEHKEAISTWAKKRQRDERYVMYSKLKGEFHEETGAINVNCEACGNVYEVTVIKQGEECNDFGIICCVFCGQQIKLYE